MSNEGKFVITDPKMLWGVGNYQDIATALSLEALENGRKLDISQFMQALINLQYELVEKP